jgi:hypothetical protein
MLLAQGRYLDVIARLGAENGLADTALVAFANYCAGLMIVGTATARCASKAASPDGSEAVYFNGDPSPGTFWRCVGLLQAGGLVIGDPLAQRLFTQMTVMSSADQEKPPDNRELSEGSFPVRLQEFQRLHGYRPVITANFTRIEIYSLYLALALHLSVGTQDIEKRQYLDQERPLTYHAYETMIEDLLHSLSEVGDAGLSMPDRYYVWPNIKDEMRSMVDIIGYASDGKYGRGWGERFHSSRRNFDRFIRIMTHGYDYDSPLEDAYLILQRLAGEFFQAARQRDASQHKSEPGQPLPPGMRGSLPSSPPQEPPDDAETPPAG